MHVSLRIKTYHLPCSAKCMNVWMLWFLMLASSVREVQLCTTWSTTWNAIPTGTFYCKREGVFPGVGGYFPIWGPLIGLRFHGLAVLAVFSHGLAGLGDFFHGFTFFLILAVTLFPIFFTVWRVFRSFFTVWRFSHYVWRRWPSDDIKTTLELE